MSNSSISSTRVVLYEPFSSARNRIAPGIHVVSTKNGSCSERSVASNRPNAFRCSVDNQLYDPCFSNSYSPLEVACPIFGKNPNQIILLHIKKLPSPTISNKLQVESSSPQAWYFELVNGTYCGMNTGAAVPIVNNLAWGVCNNRYWLAGNISSKHKLLTVLMYSKSSPITSEAIKEAWK